MARRRVALLFATSGHSGVDRVVANLIPEFARTEHRFDLLVIGGHGPAIPEDLPQSFRVIRLPVHTKKLVLPALLVYLLFRRPDALLTANHQLNRAALIGRALTGVPCRITIRMGMSLTAMGAEMRSKRRRRLFASMRRWYPRADAVIAPSEGVGRDLIRIASIDESQLHVVRNPIVNQRLQTMADAALDHEWFAPGEPPVIIGVGSLEPRKDFTTLVRAFARVRADRKCRLVILGEGSERSLLERLVHDLGVGADVDMPGFEENPYRYMARASVFALTSRREGASAVIVEALACGTPVVSTDCPSGPAEVLSDLDPPVLAPVGDAAAIADRLVCLLDRRPRQEMLRSLVRNHESGVGSRAYLHAVLGSDK